MLCDFPYPTRQFLMTKIKNLKRKYFTSNFNLSKFIESVSRYLYKLLRNQIIFLTNLLNVHLKIPAFTFFKEV